MRRPTLMGTRAMVASEHYLSAEAALRILHAGGNAFDAAVAATLVEGVVNPHMHTFGADLFRKAWTSTAAVYLPDGRLPDVGDVIRNRDLGRTFRRLIAAEERGAGHGRRHGLAAAIEAFYRGDIAGEIAAHAAAHGGLLARVDLEQYQSRVEEPVTLDYRGYTVHKCGPWSQGPVFLQQLALLAGFDLARLEPNGVDYIHTVAEVAKLAFADREQYYGDPELVDVPLAELLDERYAAARRALIDPERASSAQRPGDPRRGRALLDHGEIFAARD